MSSTIRRAKRKRSLYSHSPPSVTAAATATTVATGADHVDEKTEETAYVRSHSSSDSGSSCRSNSHNIGHKRSNTSNHISGGKVKSRVNNAPHNSSAPSRVKHPPHPTTSTTSTKETATPLSVLFGANNVCSGQLARSQFKAQKVSEYLKEKQASDSANLTGTQSLTFKLKAKKNNSQVVSSRSVECFNEQGVVVLKGNGAPLLPPALLLELKAAARRVKEQLCCRLQELAIPFETSAMELSSSGNSNSSSSNSSTRTPAFISRAEKLQHAQDAAIREAHGGFRFREVSSRCLGRIDVSLLGSLGAHPFDSPALTQHPGILQMVKSFLGQDCVLSYVGLVLSFPGSNNQPFHEDGAPLFFKDSTSSSTLSSSSYAHSDVQCPPHAINVFLPLQDIIEELGPTEFVPGSHLLQNRQQVDERLARGASASCIVQHPSATTPLLAAEPTSSPSTSFYRKRMEGAIGPLLEEGSALLYDYRVIHRGTSNLSGDPSSCRYMLYLMYTRPWFRDHMNFGDVSIFSPDAAAAVVANSNK